VERKGKNGAKDQRQFKSFEDTVFPEELALLKGRSSAATRSPADPSGLPDFKSRLIPNAGRSPFLQHTLTLLEDGDQNDLWEAWAGEQAEKRHKGLTGLALSGGGIRSSTLNLGIIQVLDKIGLFQCLDYLSTVSGGGYVGSSISANYSPPESDEPAPDSTPEEYLEQARSRFPYRHERGTPEPVGFRQLRDYSSFLVPKGFIDYMKLPVQVIRGIIVNVLVLLPLIILAALLSSGLISDDAGQKSWMWPDFLPRLFASNPFSLTLTAMVVFAALAIVFPLARRLEIWSSGWSHAHRFRSYYESAMVVVLLVIAALAFIELQPIALEFIKDPGSLTAATGGVAGLLAALGNYFARQIKTLMGRWSLYIVALAGVLAFWLLYLLLTGWFLQTPQWWEDALPKAPPAVLLTPLAIVLLAWSLLLVSANALSMHNFYRDRLAKAFLFRTNAAQDKVDNDIDPRMTDLSSGIGPFHLVNTTLNTTEFPEKFKKGRHAEPFYLSSLYSGSRITGYCRTSRLENVQKDVRLSTAVATSGAAVTSHMGVHTNPALRFILSVLNIRLGYWIINPMYFDKKKRSAGMVIGKLFSVGVVRFFQELIGMINYKTSYVYLSDGGHIENLGIYELVRRQCRLIIVGDGECDPDYTFNGLSDALRLIRVDFGINIDMDGLDEIRNGEQQFARGTIMYPDGRLGYIIYLKSSLLGDDMVEATVSDDAYVTSPLRADDRRFDELGYMAHYKAKNPAFPQESTADQFFDETQFECYRALGYLIADRAFKLQK
jgi:hypothetical protein